jgi:DNA topoisomerase-2
LRKKKKDEVLKMLKTKKYDIIEEDTDYKYLVKMPMDSVTEENVERILNECKTKEDELVTIQNTTIQQMWLKELDDLQNLYIVYKEERERNMNGITNTKKNTKTITKTNKKITLKVES